MMMVCQICMLQLLHRNDMFVTFGSCIFAFLLTLHFGFLSMSTYLLHSWASQICSPFQTIAVFSSWTLSHMFVDTIKTCSFSTAKVVRKYLLLCSIRCHHFSILCNEKCTKFKLKLKFNFYLKLYYTTALQLCNI